MRGVILAFYVLLICCDVSYASDSDVINRTIEQNAFADTICDVINKAQGPIATGLFTILSGVFGWSIYKNGTSLQSLFGLALCIVCYFSAPQVVSLVTLGTTKDGCQCKENVVYSTQLDANGKEVQILTSTGLNKDCSKKA